MEAAVKERTIQRRLFTIVYKILDQRNANQAEETDFIIQYKKLKHLHSRILELNNTIRDHMLEKHTEDEIEKELTTCLEYEEKWLQIETKYGTKTKETTSDNKDKRNFKLPKIELTKFDGSIKNWLSFWGQFEKIDLDPNIDKGDKFLYLINSVKEGTEVYNLVHSYPTGGISYDECVKELKSRYARDELLIEVYVREILTLVLQGKHNLTDLYDQLNAHLRALNTLGVEKCAAFILPLVESAIPIETLKLWERSKSLNKKNADECLAALMEFLRLEVESHQRVEIARNTFVREKEEEKTPEASASCLLTAHKNVQEKVADKKKCIWCAKETHASVECYKISKMTLEERKDHLKKEHACMICLKKGHISKKCRAFVKCHICGRRHTVAMCPGKETKEDKPGSTSTNLSSAISNKSTTLLQTLIVKVTNGGKSEEVRALIDNGSQKTYIKEEIAQKIGCKKIREEDLQHCLFGGVTTGNMKHKVYELKIESIDEKFNMKIEALGQKSICNYTDKIRLDTETNNLLNKFNIKLTETASNLNEVGLLIGADFAGVMMTSGIVNLENGMVALKTKLGWTIQGRQGGKSDNFVNTMFCMSSSQDLTELWSLETLGIKDPAEMKTKSQTEAEVLTSFEKTVTRGDDGRYQVELPFKVGIENIQSNYDKAKQRLNSMTKKLISCDKYDEYDSVLKEWLKLNIIEVAPDSDKGHYLPHKAVLKENSLTSTIRPVFDASTPDKNGLSLNSCLEKGLNFIDSIPRLLIGFRKGTIGITADIAKAFLQISLPPQDREYLKFLWWENKNLENIVEYRHCRVVFGLTASPFLLAATLRHHLNNVTGKYKNTAQLLLKSFYVDNCLYSLDTQEETYKFIEESKEILKAAQFNLRMWVTAPLQINEAGKQVIPVLGLQWDTVSDELYCNIATLPSPRSLGKVTKRVVLSLAQKIFDPIGLTCPVSLPPKLLLREAWNRKLKWDESLPKDLETEFMKWYGMVHYLSQCKIPRRLSAVNIEKSNVSLHMFSDASKNAMGACIILRTESNNNVTLRLVAAKSRVAPSKNNISIPRLELMAAVIGVRLLVGTRQSLQLSNCQEYCWTDSSVTMYWICNNLSWNTFVGNRVREIKENTKTENWSHIPGTLNWADLASRGCNAKQLLEQEWIYGPPFLMSTPAEWPKSSIHLDENEAQKELKKTVCINMCVTENFSNQLLYFSKYSKIIRMFAWMLRFINRCQKKSSRSCPDITGEEYEEAENKIMRLVQKENEETLQKSTQNLRTFIDKGKLIRLETKLTLTEMTENIRYPIIVPANNKIIQEMVKQNHERLQHAGTNTLIAEIRKKFWVFGIRRLAKSIILNCMICKKNKVKYINAPAAPLPLDRLQSSKPFEVTGVDLAGPLLLRNGDKCWIVLYTCAVYRAIHLELTPSLSTESFIRTLRRFIARRGRVKTVYSDNGTNFVGTKNLLETIDWNEVERETCVEKIKWKLNAPTAAWWGGFWERMVKTVKELLRRTLGKASVSYDELQTVLCDCESVINNRPLTYVQDDNAESLEPLTPSCFLQSLPSSETIDLDLIDSKSLNIRLKYLQKLREDFRQRFKSEYLTELVQRGRQKGKYEQIKLGHIVLVESEGKRLKWPLGIVTKIFPGKDGVNRSAEVKTASGFKVRPIQKLYLLEMSTDESGNILNIKNPQKETQNEREHAERKTLIEGKKIVHNKDNEITTQDQEKLTRCGRKVKIPSKYTI